MGSPCGGQVGALSGGNPRMWHRRPTCDIAIRHREMSWEGTRFKQRTDGQFFLLPQAGLHLAQRARIMSTRLRQHCARQLRAAARQPTAIISQITSIGLTLFQTDGLCWVASTPGSRLGSRPFFKFSAPKLSLFFSKKKNHDATHRMH